jgi:hypothetical protein
MNSFGFLLPASLQKLAPTCTGFVFLLALALPTHGLAQGSGRNACRLHNPIDPSVPLCPENGSPILNEGYPAMAVTISDSHGGPDFVVDFVKGVLAAQPTRPPQILLTVEPETQAALEQAIRQSAQTPAQRDLWLSALSRVRSFESYPWQQDIAQSTIDPRTGRPQFRALTAADSERPAISAQRNAIGQTLQQDCEIATGAPLTHPKFKSTRALNALFGGNVEGGPNGLCLVGRSKLSETEFAAFSKEVCGTGRVVAVPTQSLDVGHTDELVSTVRTGPGECDSVILLANPQLGIDRLKAQPNDRLLPGLPAEYSRDVGIDPTILYCMGQLQRAENSGRILRFPLVDRPPDSPSQRSPGRTWYRRLDTILQTTRAHAGLSAEPQNESAPSELDGPRTTAMLYRDCVGITNGQFAGLLEADPEQVGFREVMTRQLDAFRGELTQAWTQAAPNCQPRIVETPTLLRGRYYKNDQTADYGASVFNNSVNMQQFGSSVLFPKTGNAALDSDMSQRLQSLGLTPRPINTSVGNSFGGNLHCLTNAIRYCRPRLGQGNR